MFKKRSILVLLALALALTCVSCAGKRDDAGPAKDPTPSAQKPPANLADQEEREESEEPEKSEEPEPSQAPSEPSAGPTEPAPTQAQTHPADYGKGDPPLPEVPAYNGPFDPEEYGAFLAEAIGRDIVLWGQFPFSPVFIYFPEIDPSLEGWTVYIVSPTSDIPQTHMEARDLKPQAQTLALPGDINFDSARPVYTGSGGGSGELEVIVELSWHGALTYVSWDNFTWSNETDATTLIYRGKLSPERLAEMREQGLL